MLVQRLRVVGVRHLKNVLGAAPSHRVADVVFADPRRDGILQLGEGRRDLSEQRLAARTQRQTHPRVLLPFLDCPGRKPRKRAVKRPTHPYKIVYVTESRSTVESAKGA